MFPISGTGRTCVRRAPGGCVPIRPRVSHRLPTAAVFVWGSRPWTARGKRSSPSPTPSRSPRPRALRFCRVSTNAPAPVRFPRFVHRAVPRQTGGAVVEGWETQLHTPIEWGDVPVYASANVPRFRTGRCSPRPTSRRRRNHRPTRRRACRIERGDVPDQRDWPDLCSPCSGGCVPTRPLVSHRLPTAAVFVWGIAPVDSPWKTLFAKSGAESLAPAVGTRFCRVSTMLQRPRVFHASSTAPVPIKPEARWAKGGKRNSTPRLNGAMFPSTPRAIVPRF